MRVKVAVWEEGGNIFKRDFTVERAREESVVFSLPLFLPLPLSLCEHVCWCVRLPSLSTPLLFAATTDELGKGGKADVSGHRKTGGVWTSMQD